MDPLIIIASLENPKKSIDDKNGMAIFLAKKELLKKRAIRGYAKIIDTHFIDRKNIRNSLKVMNNLDNSSKKYKKYQVIFPEGTRSKNGEIKNFKGGAFRNAKKSFLPIVPITINNSLSSTNLDRKTKQIIEVIFHPSIKPINFISYKTKNIANIVQKIVESK
jgi:1-acyl-sn-glycerol-3-phosphate acyltransferase